VSIFVGTLTDSEVKGMYSPYKVGLPGGKGRFKHARTEKLRPERKKVERVMESLGLLNGRSIPMDGAYGLGCNTLAKKAQDCHTDYSQSRTSHLLGNNDAVPLTVVWGPSAAFCLVHKEKGVTTPVMVKEGHAVVMRADHQHAGGPFVSPALRGHFYVLHRKGPYQTAIPTSIFDCTVEYGFDGSVGVH